MRFEDLGWLDDPEPHAAPLNMAIDEVLLGSAGRLLLRTYRWARPAVSFGYFGKHREVLARWPDREPVRRWTGGGAVLHGEDFTYTVIAPHGHPLATLGAEASYRAIHEAIGRALETPGLMLAGATAEKVSDACFENPVRYDLVVDSRKIGGAAQRRTRRGLLHQGSIQIPAAAWPEELAARLAAALAAEIEPQSLTPSTLDAAAEMAKERYATEEWLRRR